MPVEWQGSVGETIAWLRHEGYEQDQAAAIAYRMARDRGVEKQEIEEQIRKASADRKIRERTRDYLEAALEHAKKNLPHAIYSTLYQTARARAGGRIAARNRMTALEKGMSCGYDRLSKSELAAAAGRADELYVADVRRGVQDKASYWLSSRLDDAMCARGLRQRPTLKADRSDDPGVMVALRLPKSLSEELALPGFEEPDKLHCTMVYLGRYSGLGPGLMMRACEIVEEVACRTRPLKGLLAGLGRFAGTESSDGKDVLIALVDVPGLTDMRHEIVERFAAAGIPFKNGHDFTPHVTLAYIPPDAATPRKIPDAARLRDVYFDEVVVSVNDVDMPFKLGPLPPAAEPEPSSFDAALQATLKGEQILWPGVSVEVIDLTDDGDIVLDSGAVMKTAEPIFPGDMLYVSARMGFSPEVIATDPAVREDATQLAIEIHKHAEPIPFVGPDGAAVVFVAAAPTDLEVARGEALVGADGVTFAETYLAPLRMAKAEVAIGHLMPVLPRGELNEEQVRAWLPRFFEQMARFPSAKIVAVGKIAKSILAERAACAVPHPSAVRQRRDSGEVGRKMHALAKTLGLRDNQGRTPPSHGGDSAEPTGGDRSSRTDEHQVRVSKAADEKQIVYGVVLDPYEIDTQTEWVPPAEIESTAHGFLKRSRVIGLEHTSKAKAELVESFVVPYPTEKDYKLAMQNRPHKAFVMPYGKDQVHSGAWVAGVQLGDAEWAAHKRGELNAFSIGGFSFKAKVNTAAMPQVEFVQLRY